MLRVAPLVCTGTLTASTGSNSVEVSLPVLLLFAVSQGVAAVVGWAPNTQGKSLEQIEVERYGTVIDAKSGERAAAKV